MWQAPPEIADSRHVSMRSDFLIAEGLGDHLKGQSGMGGCPTEFVNIKALTEIGPTNDGNFWITIAFV